MVNLSVYVEGQSETVFIQQILAPHLSRIGVYARIMNQGGGGIRHWEGKRGVGRELRDRLRQSKDSYRLFVTTLVDYYALPHDWPHRSNASCLPKLERSSTVEGGMLEAMRMLLGKYPRIDRFIPYVSLHEFEALILSKPDALLTFFPGHEKAIGRIKEDIASLKPEEVNDNPNCAPSKRIERFLPEYASRKSAAAVTALKAIGLEHLRGACPHFGQWLARLESLAET